MNFKTLTLLATGAALAAAPASAVAADQLVTAAPGAQNLAGGGGYLAWAAPAQGGGFELRLRAPDGTITTPDIARFDRAPETSIGSTQMAIDGRRLVAVYTRDGDLFQLDVKAGTETKLRAASTSATETDPTIVYGRIAFVRKGRHGGVFVLDKGKVRRVSKAQPSRLSFNGSRIAYPTSKGIRLHRVSGRGRDSFAREGRKGVVALNLTRYSVTFLRRDGAVFQTTRFGGSSDTDVIKGVRRAKRKLPPSTNSFVNQGSFLRYYLDDEGVHRITRDEDIFKR